MNIKKQEGYKRTFVGEVLYYIWILLILVLQVFLYILVELISNDRDSLSNIQLNLANDWFHLYICTKHESKVANNIRYCNV